MILRNVTLASLLVFSQMTLAQIVNTDALVKQVDQLQDTAMGLQNHRSQRINARPFSLSTLPPIAELVTEPIIKLPKSLPIGPDLINPLLMDVEVEEGFRAVKNQWIVMADQHSKQVLIGLGAKIESSQSYAGLGLTLLRFTVPDVLNTKPALAKHLSHNTFKTLDRNHIYQAQTRKNLPIDSRIITKTATHQGIMCDTPVRIGMIDSAIDTKHRAFSTAKIYAKSFLANNLRSPSLHGSAVASVLIGNTDELTALLPQAELYSAEVFYRQSDFSQGATLSAIIDALNWMLEQKIAVINMSLAGPDNRILEHVINTAIHKGAFIVAAAGNEGPAAAAVYPAGYENVIAVSAFDKNRQPYRWSNRGDYIDYSALGVNVLSAQPQQSLGKESGTSMAAPVVSAALACVLAKQTMHQKLNRVSVLISLLEQAVDLGPKGRDPIFGAGAIQRLYSVGSN
ncbi:S8 family serine peptidase [Paraglaciecola sp. MB-3u-78]|uniref:S8 family serine peptidase n=1 Tax=Paraglaciecola sp. MB-3u-78 TaxID=2058332 RepID=UPI000C3262AD|nr:S8 family serine peptidase [Paraglaciecola sp. MB-3u-78]PKG98697.1 protease [Paraglaciecola sp. MB-3u-78]